MDQPELSPDGLSRRDALKRAGVVAGVAGVAWAAPSITTLGGAAFAVGSPAGSGSTYDLVALFNGKRQPSPFSVRQSSSGALLTIKAFVFGNPALPSLQGGNSGNTDATFPFLLKNTSASDQSMRGISIPPGAVIAHPDDNANNLLIIRFTAPSAGTYGIIGSLTDADASGGDGITYSFNGTAATVPNGGGASLNGSVVLAAGQTVDLSIGPNGGYGSDSTNVQLAFTAQ